MTEHFININHRNPVIHPEVTPQNVTKIIERPTMVDMSGVEDLLAKLIEVVHSAPRQPINVSTTAPIVNVKTPEQAIPQVHVEPKIEVRPQDVNVFFDMRWVFAAIMVPTLVMAFDIYLRLK